MFAADDRPTAHPVALSQEDQLKKATRDAEARQATLQAEKDALEQELAKERAKVDELRQKQQTSAILAAMPAAMPGAVSDINDIRWLPSPDNARGPAGARGNAHGGVTTGL